MMCHKPVSPEKIQTQRKGPKAQALMVQGRGEESVRLYVYGEWQQLVFAFVQLTYYIWCYFVN